MSLTLQLLDLSVPLLVNVAFVTLMERKILGLSQYRRGPNKSAFWGLLQPFSDAIKLFSKELVQLSAGNSFLFNLAPLVAIILALWIWVSIPNRFTSASDLTALLILTLLGLGIYPLFLSGWASNSKFAQLGSVRAIAQTISYEISLAIILFSFVLLASSLIISADLNGDLEAWQAIIPLLGMWLIICVAETNRTPFDFAEGESELVSGFNIEYGGGLFAVIFMAEYAMILVFSSFTPILMFTAALPFYIYSCTVIIAGWWIWLRSTFPRHRYDKLLNLAWKSILPLSLALAIFYSSLKLSV